jgi:hypothetical protein
VWQGWSLVGRTEGRLDRRVRPLNVLEQQFDGGGGGEGGKESKSEKEEEKYKHAACLVGGGTRGGSA